MAVERRGLGSKLALAVLIAAGLAFAYYFQQLFGLPGARDGQPALPALLAFIATLSAAATLLRLRFTPTVAVDLTKCRKGAISIDGDGIVVEQGSSTHTYPAGSVLDGWIEDPDDRTTVLLRMRGGDVVSIDAPDMDGARRLLAAAGVAADQQAVRMRLVNHTTQVLGGGCIAAAGAVAFPLFGAFALLGTLQLGLLSVPGAVLAFCSAFFLLLIYALIPARVVIGTDGLTIERVFSRRFIPFAAIDDVQSEFGAVVITVAEKQIRLPTGERYSSAGRQQASAQSALYNRIVEAQAAGQRGGDGQARAADLERGGRTLAQWRAHLRGLTGGAGETYRRRAVAPESLAGVLEDAAAPAERRIAAALALGFAEDAALAERARRAASTCASPKLRIALEAAARDELGEAELEAAAEAEREAAALAVPDFRRS
jgi:hypothetical protein